MKYLGNVPNDYRNLITKFNKKRLRMDWIINKKLALIVDNPLPLDGPVLHVEM